MLVQENARGRHCITFTTSHRLLCRVSLAEQLSQKDAVITRALSEKLQLFADLAEYVIGPEDAASRSRLLLRGDTPDLQQGEALLKGAITEGTLTSGGRLAYRSGGNV